MPLREFALGALTTLSLIIALFFLRYWRRSADRLFLCFALAFAILALEWVGHAVFDPDLRHYIFLVRLVAFALILLGIIDKNRRATAP